MENKILQVQEIIHCDAFTIWLQDYDETNYVFIASGEKADRMRDIIMQPGEGLCGKCIQTGKTVISNDVEKDKLWARNVDEITGFHTKKILCYPIIIEGIVYGCIELVNKHDGNFDEKDIEICKDIESIFESDF